MGSRARRGQRPVPSASLHSTCRGKDRAPAAQVGVTPDGTLRLSDRVGGDWGRNSLRTCCSIDTLCVVQKHDTVASASGGRTLAGLLLLVEVMLIRFKHHLFKF